MKDLKLKISTKKPKKINRINVYLEKNGDGSVSIIARTIDGKIDSWTLAYLKQSKNNKLNLELLCSVDDKLIETCDRGRIVTTNQ